MVGEDYKLNFQNSNLLEDYLEDLKNKSDIELLEVDWTTNEVYIIRHDGIER
jgi:hypothetical protein